jgi:hypothetical protein
MHPGKEELPVDLKKRFSLCQELSDLHMAGTENLEDHIRGRSMQPIFAWLRQPVFP